MGWRSLIAWSIVSGTYAFAFGPIRWTGLPARNFVITPRASPNMVSQIEDFRPQELAILERPGKISPDVVPYFNVNHDSSITWKGLCVEAGSTDHGHVARINRCTGGSAQRWKWLQQGHGQSTQIQLKDSKLCLDVMDDNDLNGAPVGLRDCEGPGTGFWKFEDPNPSPMRGHPGQLEFSPAARHAIFSSLVLVAFGLWRVIPGLWHWRSTLRAMAEHQEAVPMGDDIGGVCLSTKFAMHGGSKPAVPSVLVLSPMHAKDDDLHPREDAVIDTVNGGAATSAVTSAKDRFFPVDVALLMCYIIWFFGNYRYNIDNKLALKAVGGAAGFPVTIATLQLGVGVLFALFLWWYPDSRRRPNLTLKEWTATLPVGFAAAGGHAGSVFALSAGAVSFAQIVKAAEPAFAAVVGTFFYNAKLSKAAWVCLIPVIGGVCLASVGELSFSWGALLCASMANIFAAVESNENEKLLATKGFKERIGSINNQFAIYTINSFMFCLLLLFFTEGSKLGEFISLVKASPALFFKLISSGLWLYIYGEFSTMTIEKTGAIAQSVANTAKRVIIILAVSYVMGESLHGIKMLGCAIGIGGVLLYSVIDAIVEKFRARKARKQKRTSAVVSTPGDGE